MLRRAIGGALRAGLARAGVEIRANRFVDPAALQRHLVTVSEPVLFDVGAHVGETYDSFRRTFGPRASIHCVEPFPESLGRLRARVGADPACRVHAVALADAEGERTLHVNQASATSSLAPLSEGARETWNAPTLAPRAEVTVPVRRLDALCAELGIERIDVLKMDVQGGEHDVLVGAGSLLEEGRVDVLQFEYINVGTYAGQKPLSAYLTLLEGAGYALQDLVQPLRRDGRLLQADLVFVSPALAARRPGQPSL